MKSALATLFALVVCQVGGQETPPVPFAPPGSAGGAPLSVQQAPKALPDRNDARDQHQKCTWTAPSGHLFDLSALQKPQGADDWDVRFEKQNFRLKINVCSNVDETKLPPGCRGLTAKGVFSPVWQTNEPGQSCYYLGNLAKPNWYLIDKTKPEKGVVLSYSDGQQCGARGSRTVSLHMVCANNFESKEPPTFAYESPMCHYHVVWPTKHACPSNGPAVTRHITLTLVVLYFVVRSAYNKFIKGGEGLEVIPHIFFIQSCCSGILMLVLSGVDFVKGFASKYKGADGGNREGAGGERDIESEQLTPMVIQGGDSL